MSKPNVDPMSRPNAPAERQLSEVGQVQAKSIGVAMRKLGIPVGLVLTSMAQRAMDHRNAPGIWRCYRHA